MRFLDDALLAAAFLTRLPVPARSDLPPGALHRARGFAQAHVHLQQRVQAQFGQQSFMPRLGRAMGRTAMVQGIGPRDL